MRKAELIKIYSPSLRGDAAYGNFAGKLCSRLMDRAEEYAGKELWGNALVWYQKAEAINPNYQELFQKILETKDYIK